MADKEPQAPANLKTCPVCGKQFEGKIKDNHNWQEACSPACGIKGAMAKTQEKLN